MRNGIEGALANILVNIRETHGEARAEECRREVEAALKGEWRPPKEEVAEREQVRQELGVTLIDSQDVRRYRLEQCHRRDCEGCQGECRHKGTYEGYRMEHAVLERYDGEREAVFYVKACHWTAARAKQETLNSLFKTSGLPKKYRDKTFADYAVNDVNRKAVALAKQGSGLYICGETGSGKTFLACLMGQEAAKRGESVLFATVPELMNALKPSAEEPERRLESAKTAELLILDDLGAERPTDWAGEQLYTLLDYRTREELRTVITSELKPREAFRRYADGERLLRRAKEATKLVITYKG